MDIYEALEHAAELREQADKLRQEADDLEYEWVGASSGDVLTVERLVHVIRKVGQGSRPDKEELDSATERVLETLLKRRGYQPITGER